MVSFVLYLRSRTGQNKVASIPDLKWFFFACYVILFTSTASVWSDQTEAMWTPSEFVYELVPPGRSNQLLRPSAIFADRKFGEIYVADPGHNRVALFDKYGNFRFEFVGGEYFSTPAGVAVDSAGFVYLIGSTKEGRRVFVFDYDGQFVREVELARTDEGLRPDVGSIAFDNDNNLYLLDRQGYTISSYDENDQFRYSFPVLEGLPVDEVRKQVVGTIRIEGELLLVPVGSMGTLRVMSLEGDLIRTIGRRGNRTGQLGFPVDAALSPDGILLVLDKHRYNVVCFDLEGKFLGEFGGKGISPGWFYHPTLLSVDGQGLVYIGQKYRSKVQVCRIPDSIRRRHEKGPQGLGLTPEYRTLMSVPGGTLTKGRHAREEVIP